MPINSFFSYMTSNVSLIFIILIMIHFRKIKCIYISFRAMSNDWWVQPLIVFLSKLMYFQLDIDILMLHILCSDEKSLITSCDGSKKDGPAVFADFYEIQRPCTCIVTPSFVGELLVTSKKVIISSCNTRVSVSSGIIFLMSIIVRIISDVYCQNQPNSECTSRIYTTIYNRDILSLCGISAKW